VIAPPRHLIERRHTGGLELGERALDVVDAEATW
jgi:hypothetical protein